MTSPEAYFLEVGEQVAQQTINSEAIYREYRRVAEAARPYSGGMYWKRVGEYEYLTKTGKRNSQMPIGARSDQTQGIYEAFHRKKNELEPRLATLRKSLVEAERFNKAAKAGRVPTIVVELLRVIEDHGLERHFTVVGTHALYAYEAAAGVRIVQKALATQDVDLLWDVRKRIKFETDMERIDRTMMGVLRQVDATFVLKELHHETAINARGFQVDFLRRMQEGDDPHPVRLTADIDDPWPVQARRAKVLAEAPVFEQPIISATGKLATMRTVSPAVFIEFKRWMAKQADREVLKRRRDATQADIVEMLIEQGRL